MPEHRIIINKQPLSIESAIAVAVQPLINDGIVYSNYTAAILKQFEQFGSYMVISPHIALIHAGTDYVQNGVGFALTYFTEGIIFGSKANDPVHLVITLATDHQCTFKGIGTVKRMLKQRLISTRFLRWEYF